MANSKLGHQNTTCGRACRSHQDRIISPARLFAGGALSAFIAWLAAPSAIRTISLILAVILSRTDGAVVMTPPRSGSSRQPNRTRAVPAETTSLLKLKPLEAVQLLLDAALQLLARAAFGALADPAPFLHQQFAVLSIGLQIECGDDVLARQHR